MQRAGEAAAQPRRLGRRREDHHLAAPERVVVGPHVAVGRDRRVGEDQVELVAGQPRDQALELVAAALEADAAREVERRLDHPVRDQLVDHVDHPDDQPRAPPRGAAVDRVNELAPEAEDLVRVAEGRPAGVGELQAATDAGEEARAEALLELTHLRGDRRLRETQAPARGRHAPFAGHRPEVQQVVVVEPIFGHIEIFDGNIEKIDLPAS